MSARGKILNTISSLQSSLTKTEKKIAAVILSQPELLSQCSLSEVSKHLDVGEATFIRFCRTLGFKGYTDFKLELAIELATQNQDKRVLLDTDVSEGDTSKDIANKLKTAWIVQLVKLLIYLILMYWKKLYRSYEKPKEYFYSV